MQNPLNKVVFIQKVVTFSEKSHSLKDLLQLAYVNNSWNDTIKNYSFHLFEQQLRDAKNITDDSLEEISDVMVNSGVIWFVHALLCSKTLLHRINIVRLLCKNASSLDMMRVVFEKIEEAGGPVLLKSQLSVTDNCGANCLMLASEKSSPPEVMKFLFEKISEAGGINMLKHQLVEKNNCDWTCLMICCNYSSSSEVMKLIFERIVEVGGIALLKKQLVATDIYGWSCFMYGCSNSASSEVVKLLAAVLFELDVFKQQYEQDDQGLKANLRHKAEIKDASWVPDPESIAEVREILQRSKTDDKKKADSGRACVLQ